LQSDDRSSFRRAVGCTNEVHLTADQPDMPSSCSLRIDLAGEVDLERAIDRDEPAEIAEH